MWPNREETDRLLDDARKGEPGAVDRLLGEFREPLRRVIDLRLDPAIARRVDASDIVQDVLIEASQRLTDYLKSPDMPFHLWLRHLAQDRIIDTHRRHRLAQRRSVDREQPIARPAWADESSVSLIAQLIDTERTPTSEAIRHELQPWLALPAFYAVVLGGVLALCGVVSLWLTVWFGLTRAIGRRVVRVAPDGLWVWRPFGWWSRFVPFAAVVWVKQERPKPGVDFVWI